MNIKASTSVEEVKKEYSKWFFSQSPYWPTPDKCFDWFIENSCSLPSSSVTGESEAIEFAEWLNENRWYSFDRDKQKWCYTFEHGTSLSKGVYEKNYMKTSAQLFEIYKQQKK